MSLRGVDGARKGLLHVARVALVMHARGNRYSPVCAIDACVQASTERRGIERGVILMRSAREISFRERETRF